MKTYRIHLIRHGEIEGNTAGKYVGRTDLPLTEQGREEIRKLAKSGVYPEVDLVFSSPMERCLETADIIYPETDPVIIDELRECDFGDFEGRTAEDLKELPEFTEWIAGRADPPHGEGTVEFAKRIAVGFNRVVRAMMELHETEAAVILHGGVMMMLFAACAVPRKKIFDWATDNGRGYTVTVTPSLYQRTGVIEVTGEI